METIAREILESGNLQAFEEFMLSNSDKINIQYVFDEGLTFPIILIQTYRKAESLILDRSQNPLIENYKQCLNFLFENGCDLDAQDNMGRTFAHWSILLHCVDLLAVALGFGCNPMLQDSEGETIVHLAIRYNDLMGLETIHLYSNKPDVFECTSETSGATPLIYAVQIGAVDIAKKLLQLNVNINAQENNKYKRTALHYALFTDNEEIFTLLLKNKAKSDIKDYKDKSVIDRVAEYPKDNFLRIITHYSSSEIFSSPSNNPNNPIGYSPLIVACKNSDFQMLSDLIDNETDPEAKLNLLKVDNEMRTALHHCVDNSDTKCVEKLIKLDPTLIGKKDRNGFTVLHLATIANNMKLVQILIKNGCDTKEQDNDGHTSLHWAVVCCATDLIDLFFKIDPEIISIIDNHGASALHYATQSFLSPEGSMQGPIVIEKLLKNNKENVNCVDYDNRTPLLWAASLGITDCCQILLENGADINHRDCNGLSVLHCAASRGHYDVIDLIVNTWSMLVDIEDNNLCTPLFYAVTLKHMSIIHFLIEQRSNPNQQDIKGRSVAHCAALKGYCDILDLIRKAGASLTLRNNNGDLPLHEAAEIGKYEVCELLLNKMEECNEIELINEFNKRGLTPLHKAAQNNHHKICKLLISRGANANILSKPSQDIPSESAKSNLTPLDLASDTLTIDMLKDFRCKKASELNAEILLENNVKIDSDEKSQNYKSNNIESITKSVESKPIEIQKLDLVNKKKNSENLLKPSKFQQNNFELKRPRSSRSLKINSQSSKIIKSIKPTNNIDRINGSNKSPKLIKSRLRNPQENKKSLKTQSNSSNNLNSQGNINNMNSELQTNNLNETNISENITPKLNGTGSKHTETNKEDNIIENEVNEEKNPHENSVIEDLGKFKISKTKPTNKEEIVESLEKISVSLTSLKTKNSKESKNKPRTKSAKPQSETELIENGIDIKAISYNSLCHDSTNNTTSSSVSSHTSNSRKSQKSKSTELSSRVIESVRQYEIIREKVKSITEQRRMELFQGYSKTLKLEKMQSKKPVKSAKVSKGTESNINQLNLPDVSLFETSSNLHTTQASKRQQTFPTPISKNDQIRSAYDCGSANYLPLY